MRKLVLAAEEEAANAAAVRGNNHFLAGAAVPVTVGGAAMDRGQKIALAVFVSSVILSAVVGFLCAYAFAHPGSSSSASRNNFHLRASRYDVRIRGRKADIVREVA